MGGKLDFGIAEIAGRQYGVVSREQLRALDLGDDAIDHRLTEGRLHRLHRGVYAVGHPVVSLQGRWLAAVLACGPRAALSHRSAAALWDLRPTSAARIDVVVPTQAGRAQPGIWVHRCASLADDEVATTEGIAVTTVARTLLDLARTASRRTLDRAVEAAEIRRILDLADIEAVLLRHRGRPGTRRLDAAIARLRPGHEQTRSPLERLILEVCDDHDLGRPEINVEVEGFVVDFLWRRERVIVEADSRRFHATDTAFERDRERDARLAAAGYQVLRYTHRRATTEPGKVAQEMRAVLRRARRAAAPPGADRRAS